MTREEFEAEYRVIRDANAHSTGILNDLYKLSDDALRFIVDNEGKPFGKWLVDKAIDLVFEDIALKGDDDAH